jgi:hypothetical protein
MGTFFVDDSIELSLREKAQIPASLGVIIGTFGQRRTIFTPQHSNGTMLNRPELTSPRKANGLGCEC